MANALSASAFSTRLLTRCISARAPTFTQASVRCVAPLRRSSQRQQIRTMASDGPTDTKYDKSTPDSVWKTILDAQTVRVHFRNDVRVQLNY